MTNATLARAWCAWIRAAVRMNWVTIRPASFRRNGRQRPGDFAMSDAPTPPNDILRGDPTALAAFLEQRRPALVAFIEGRLGSTLRGKVDPQDIAQDVAIKALRELPQTDLGDRDP